MEKRLYTQVDKYFFYLAFVINVFHFFLYFFTFCKILQLVEPFWGYLSKYYVVRFQVLTAVSMKSSRI
jgi:hypothetical protein